VVTCTCVSWSILPVSASTAALLVGRAAGGRRLMTVGTGQARRLVSRRREVLVRALRTRCNNAPPPFL